MAVQGKLVPQDLHDEPASELLKNIPAEKAKFIKESKLKKEKSLPAITEDEIPYDLPEGWVWCRLNDIATIYTGNSINENEKKNKYTDLSDGYSYIATKDINFNGSVNYESGVKIPYNTSLKVAHKNNVLICTEGGSAGRKIAIINHNVCFVNKLCCLCGHMVNPRYLYYYLRSMVFQLQFTAAMTGIIGGVGLSAMKHLIIPIPPLAEQQRIVAKVGELMVLCEKLKSAKTSPVKTVEPKIVPFPQAEPEEEIEIAARGDAEDLPREALDDLTELFGDGKND